MAVFMLGESGERLCRRALPDRGDAKPSCADTPTQITGITHLSVFGHTKTDALATTSGGHNTEHSLFQV